MIATDGLSPVFVYSVIALFGWVIGSFLNVVISRLPTMLATRWQRDAADILDQDAPRTGQRFDLIAPRSQCPRCRTSIKPWHNIPIIGYLMLRGRCAACGARISIQYPLIELLAGVLAVIAILRFGMTAWAACVVVFSWFVLTLAAIDWKTQLLPDCLTLPLLWLGLMISVTPIDAGVDPSASIIGAIAGYGVLRLVFELFLWATGKVGMGHGDFKLAAALGAWIGWQQLPLTIFIASAGGALIGAVLIASGRMTRTSAMPFGPWLAFGGWLALIAGDTIGRAYLTLSGLR